MTEMIIYLHINQGTGLLTQKKSVQLTAKLGQNILESEIVTSHTDVTIFNNNLIWETDRVSIKRMKSDNLPIKVECFTIYENKRDFIGHILLPIRNIPTLVSGKIKHPKCHWHKLLNLSYMWRSRKPEISLYAIITDKSNINEDGDLIMPDNEKTYDQTDDGGLIATSEMLQSQKGINIELLDENDLLQIGDKTVDNCRFDLEIVLKCGHDLEKMINISSKLDDQQSIDMSYALLGNRSHFFTLQRSVEQSVFKIDQNIVIHTRSSLKMLQEYLDNVFCLPIQFYHDKNLCGFSVLSLAKIIPTTNLDEFCNEITKNDVYHVSDLKCDISCSSNEVDDVLPSISYEFIIHYKPSVNLNYLNKKTVEPIKLTTIANVEDDDGHKCSDKTSPGRIQEVEPSIDSKTISRTFSFNLIIESAKFHRNPELGIWQMSLHHPKADTPLTIINMDIKEHQFDTVNFNGTELCLYFSSSIESIKDIVTSEPSVLNIKGPRAFYATAELDNHSLLAKENQTGIILMENEAGEKIAMCNAYVCLNDLGINFNSHVRKFTNTNKPAAPRSPYLNEQLTYKMLEELEEWKAKQREMFVEELKRREKNYMDKLTNEWELKRKDQENELDKKLKHCNELTLTLEQSHKTLQDKSRLDDEEKKLLIDDKCRAEQSLQIKQLEFQDRIQYMETEHEHQMKMQDLKYKELSLENLILEKENVRLKDMINDLNEQIREINKSKYEQSKDQFSGLFQELKGVYEKLETVERSKLFYKQQWARVIREMYRIKMDEMGGQCVDRLDITQLPLNELANFIETERSDLETEQNELDSIKKLLNCT